MQMLETHVKLPATGRNELARDAPWTGRSTLHGSLSAGCLEAKPCTASEWARMGRHDPWPCSSRLLVQT